MKTMEEKQASEAYPPFSGSVVCCPNCDYMISKTERDHVRFDMDCPRCGAQKFSMFYSLGSQTHRDRRRDWEEGRIKGAPLPFPQNAQIETERA